jgi:DNA-binding transcriptional regulator LsrR (DeoR family)
MMNDELLNVAFQAVRMYAESHPRPHQVTQRQAAEMLGLSAPTIGRMVKAGTLRLNAAGLIPISEIDAALLAKAA